MHVHLSAGASPVPRLMCQPEFPSAQLCTGLSLNLKRRHCAPTLTQAWILRSLTIELSERMEDIPTDSSNPCSQFLNGMRAAQPPYGQAIPGTTLRGRVEGPGGQSLQNHHPLLTPYSDPAYGHEAFLEVQVEMKQVLSCVVLPTCANCGIHTQP